ncbi:MAG: glycosyltransferase family 2 protein [Patescibacteria group bacterium]|nr:glycosyltransferase family 2 protein [Patescibacteria group bacterium]
MILSIIIVNWNVKKLLEKCLNSIFKNVDGLDYEVWVVDNNSADGSREYLKSLISQNENLKVILNEQNIGFAKANNQALKEATGEFVLLLNPDTEIIGNTLQTTVQFMQYNQDCGVLGGKLIGRDDKIQKSVRSFPTILSQAMVFLKFHRFFYKVKILKDYFQTDFDYEKISEVDQVMGAFLMTKKEVLEKVGLLDEKFWLWFEEVDFCKRVKEAGYKVIYYPNAAIFHYGAQSFRQMLSCPKQRTYNRSTIYYFKKHSRFVSYWPLLILNPISLFLACLVQIFSFRHESH